MRSDELAEKLGKLFALFGQGKDKKIKHKDLDKIIAKLTALRDSLGDEAAKTKAAKKAERLALQRDTAARMLDRAVWLHGQLEPHVPETPSGATEADELAASAPETAADIAATAPQVPAQD